MALASCLVICPRMSCFRAEHTRQELMDVRQFGHEFYVLRVADWYKRLGHNVEIHPPPGHDITISIGGFPTHLECKTKRPLAERDIRVEAVWERMYELMNKEMDRAGINAIVYVDSATDPVDEDLGRLIGTFRTLLDEGRNITALLHDNKYKITIRLTPRPGEAIKTAGLKWRPWGQFERGTSAVKVTKEGAQWWDVRHFFFNSREDRDYVKTVLYSLAQAGKQLPKEGPGIVYIEVAPPSGQTPIGRRLSEIRQRLVRELRDGHNRRVNAVILSCTHFEPPEGLTVNFASVFHPNPRAPLPTGFHVAGTREDSGNSKILPLNF